MATSDDEFDIHAGTGTLHATGMSTLGMYVCTAI